MCDPICPDASRLAALFLPVYAFAYCKPLSTYSVCVCIHTFYLFTFHKNADSEFVADYILDGDTDYFFFESDDHGSLWLYMWFCQK